MSPLSATPTTMESTYSTTPTVQKLLLWKRSSSAPPTVCCSSSPCNPSAHCRPLSVHRPSSTVERQKLYLVFRVGPFRAAKQESLILQSRAQIFHIINREVYWPQQFIRVAEIPSALVHFDGEICLSIKLTSQVSHSHDPQSLSQFKLGCFIIRAR